MKNILCALGLSLTLGCATTIVRPYVGEQQVWPTAGGSICNARFDLPVFTSLPPAPYDLIAELRISSALHAQPEEGHMPVLVKTAIALGADALALVDGQSFFSKTYGARNAVPEEGAKKQTMAQVNKFNPESFKSGVSVIAIRWAAEPPAGLPARYVRYSDKLKPEVEAETPAAVPAATPASVPEVPAQPAAETPAPAEKVAEVVKPVEPAAPVLPPAPPAPAPAVPEPVPVAPEAVPAPVAPEVVPAPTAPLAPEGGVVPEAPKLELQIPAAAPAS